MHDITKFYLAWGAFWFTYFLLEAFLPQCDKPLFHGKNKITKKKAIERVMANCISSGIFIPLVYILPILDIDTRMYLTRYVLASLIGEIWFYYSHRLMHHKHFYKWHADHHRFIQSQPYAAVYCSTFEMIFVNTLSMAIPFRLLNFSPIEMSIGGILVALNTMNGHSGLQTYKLKYNPYYSWISSPEHDYHHEKMTCNYGVLYILDRLHGTYRVPS